MRLTKILATIGPATDLFSFCVALWRGVYGQMPFEGESLIQLGFRVVEELASRRGVRLDREECGALVAVSGRARESR